LKPPIIKVGFFISNKKIKIEKIILATLLVILGFMVSGSFLKYTFLKYTIKSQPTVLKGAPSGTMTIVASSTKKIIVGPGNATTLFSVNSSCTSRKITTYANPIMLTFATSTDLDQTVEPTGSFGHLQAASTTVDYDSGTNGCGVWQAFGFGASTTISISEFEGFR